jgi:hypothetical protein
MGRGGSILGSDQSQLRGSQSSALALDTDPSRLNPSTQHNATLIAVTPPTPAVNHESLDGCWEREKVAAHDQWPSVARMQRFKRKPQAG